MTQFLPTVSTDGQQAVSSMNDIDAYHSHLKYLCVSYVELLNELCAADDSVRQELDKLNVHRLVELFHHSIPRYGHVSNFDELAFESSHQPLKRAMERSNRNRGHLYSMRATLANEWRLRLGQACAQLPIDTELSDDHCRQLLSACFGQVPNLENQDLSFDDVRSAFIPPVIQEFRKYASQTRQCASSSRTPVWTVQKNKIIKRPAVPYAHCLGIDDSRVRRYLGRTLGESRNAEGGTPIIVREYECAVRRYIENSTETGDGLDIPDGKGKSKKYNTVHPGDAIQALISLSDNALSSFLSTPGVHTLSTSASTGVPSYWLVLGIFKAKGFPFVYAHVRALQRCVMGNATQTDLRDGGGCEIDELEPLYRVFSGACQVIMRLDDHCARAMLLHCCHDHVCYGSNCTGRATFLSGNDDPDESLRQGSWTLLGPAHGYPQRTS